MVFLKKQLKQHFIDIFNKMFSRDSVVAILLLRFLLMVVFLFVLHSPFISFKTVYLTALLYGAAPQERVKIICAIVLLCSDFVLLPLSVLLTVLRKNLYTISSVFLLFSYIIDICCIIESMLNGMYTFKIILLIVHIIFVVHCIIVLTTKNQSEDVSKPLK